MAETVPEPPRDWSDLTKGIEPKIVGVFETWANAALFRVAQLPEPARTIIAGQPVGEAPRA